MIEIILKNISILIKNKNNILLIKICRYIRTYKDK